MALTTTNRKLPPLLAGALFASLGACGSDIGVVQQGGAAPTGVAGTQTGTASNVTVAAGINVATAIVPATGPCSPGLHCAP